MKMLHDGSPFKLTLVRGGRHLCCLPGRPRRTPAPHALSRRAIIRSPSAFLGPLRLDVQGRAHFSRLRCAPHGGQVRKRTDRSSSSRLKPPGRLVLKNGQWVKREQHIAS